MSNTQSKIDSLQELNSQLIATIAELRKENAKIPELEKKFAEIKSENVKLKRIIEENEKRNVRVEELEQKNIELQTRLAILEQGKEEKSISTEDVAHSPVNFNDSLKQIVLPCGDTPISASSKLPEAEVSISTSSHLVSASDNKSRPSISILPDDPEEKRKSVIDKVLKQFPYLSSKYSRPEGASPKGS